MANIFPHKKSVSRAMKEKMHGHRGFTLWLTGLPSSGKSSIASELEHLLHKKGCFTVLLDGDTVRSGLNSDLGFSKRDREENVRRVGEMARTLTENGNIVLVSLISPFRKTRNSVRAGMRRGDFVEVYVSCPPEECEKRDPKGLYKRARAGKIPRFTGVSSPYEKPLKPEIIVDTMKSSVDQSAQKIYRYLLARKYLKNE